MAVRPEGSAELELEASAAQQAHFAAMMEHGPPAGSSSSEQILLHAEISNAFRIAFWSIAGFTALGSWLGVSFWIVLPFAGLFYASAAAGRAARSGWRITQILDEGARKGRRAARRKMRRWRS